MKPLTPTELRTLADLFQRWLANSAIAEDGTANALSWVLSREANKALEV